MYTQIYVDICRYTQVYTSCKLIFLYLKAMQAYCKCYTLNIMDIKLHELSWIRIKIHKIWSPQNEPTLYTLQYKPLQHNKTQTYFIVIPTHKYSL